MIPIATVLSLNSANGFHKNTQLFLYIFTLQMKSWAWFKWFFFSGFVFLLWFCIIDCFRFSVTYMSDTELWKTITKNVKGTISWPNSLIFFFLKYSILQSLWFIRFFFSWYYNSRSIVDSSVARVAFGGCRKSHWHGCYLILGTSTDREIVNSGLHFVKYCT